MADEKLAEELAEHLAERDGRRSLFTDDPDAIERAYRDEYRRTAQVAVEWLAERGRLVPDGATVAEEWACEVIFADGDIERWYESHRENAELLVATHPARRCLIRRTVITTPWVAVQPERTQEETK